MGIKKSSALRLMYFAIAMSTGLDVFDDGVKQPKLLPTPQRKPFNKQEGIVNLIKDYKLIKSGQSKKGKLKQHKIISKVDEFIKQGFLSMEDLTND